MKMKFILITLGITFLGCKKKEVSQYTDTPIIESYLQSGSNFKIKISRQIPFASDAENSEDDIDNLNIKVNFNGNDYFLTPTGNGNYINDNFIAVEGVQYNLFFNFNKKNVSAYTYIPTKPIGLSQSATEILITKMDLTSGPPSGGTPGTPPTMPDPINISWTNTDDSFYLLVIENIETDPEAITDFGTNAPPERKFKKSPTKSSGIEIKSMEFNYYGQHRLILYHVLPDYASLYDASSTSSQNLSNPSTSIVNGYGIFTGLNSDTLMLNVKKN